MKRLSSVVFTIVAVAAFGAGKKKKDAGPPPPLTQTGFAGVAVGASKGQVAQKGFLCKDEHIGDYLVIHECRKPCQFDGKDVDGYVQLNNAGGKAEAVGFDLFFPGDQISAAQEQFYKFEKAVEVMLGATPTSTPTPDTYLAMTNFAFTKTIVSCFLYSDDRTKPPLLRCGVEVRNKK